MDVERRIDFFISFVAADRQYALWLDSTLQSWGYSTLLGAPEFRPGTNRVLAIQRAFAQARRTIIVLSPDYLTSADAQAEWAAVLSMDPTGVEGRLVPIRVRACEPTGFLAS